ncbi:DUF1622 domain-containing protein [Vagococcus luciliae]|uniref:DUF1622 domain-containing protein n=1 Tax=Vagococcus luciliae TaxID=2920380 RepID=A0ABY5NZJ3_9ENTE|nr:DUF1622 domain-containing protein [Vagococcus luciliae]UUV99091.1 hypothetical protein G314FT_12500 [Vagococcus luciliae]
MISEVVDKIIFVLNAFSVIILLVGVAKAIVDFTKNEFGSGTREEISFRNNKIKLYLGSYILLSLEVLIASDIIETILNPSTQDIVILGGIVVIRTAISYFLGKEIEQTHNEEE